MEGLVGPRPLEPVPAALAVLHAGGAVAVVEDRHGRGGEVVVAAQRVTAEHVTLMATHARGLVCLPLAPDRCDRLGLAAMVPPGTDTTATAFTVSIDLEVEGSTGISAHDRARTVRHAVAADARPDDFRRPGHVFPIRVAAGGVLDRAHHAEAAVDLVRLAGLAPAAVSCHVLAPDGDVADADGVRRFAAAHDLPVVTVGDVVAHRRRHESLVERVVDAGLPTAWGTARAIGYRGHDGAEHVAVVVGDVTGADDVLAAVHAECLPGDLFRSRRCACGDRLDDALRDVHAAGRGVVVHTRRPDGPGLATTAQLPHGPGPAEVRAAAHVLRDLGPRSVRLHDDDPQVRRGLAEAGIDLAVPTSLPTTTPARGIA